MTGKIKILISGGGTGGHIFPAISIANTLKEKMPECSILFVGAKGRIEEEKVPAAGYEIKSLPVQGFKRKLAISNLKVVYNLIISLFLARKIVKTYKPDVVVGVGGYASGPVLWVAARCKIPTLIQEQNSYAGLTNRLLSKRVCKVCVAYDGLERFFDATKIVLTGNPVRKNILENTISTRRAKEFYSINTNQKVVLILGGSGGAKQINESVKNAIEKIAQNKDLTFIWQTGKFYYDKVIDFYKKNPLENILVKSFLPNMDYAYKAADIVVTRAGAATISELSLLGKPAIFVPSPNVAENHQMKNAMNLVDKNAALLVKDSEAPQKLLDTAIALVRDEEKMKILSENIKQMAFPNADAKIADEIIHLAKQQAK
ncbi:MAG: undecaprenyldiphospho-muramoylpentapeptide beta-N-acetylglucosaminyltransferase [Bacteroidia bacterium]|nr:MAG: undecaprenyldiphospho-muramoylpentapeptide beta-N-acetylglucosaminyltransferase [Bacteroidia bacterium]PIE86411.1 MAG: undecaprenyldiphospho-muramoylpentapeptide beta-N-acetylglucosaminyltransferase [Bacteroidia bacterium]